MKHMIFYPLVIAIMLVAVTTVGISANAQELATETSKTEEQVLINHVHEIFNAFLARDRDRLRSLHTEDWVGFLGPSIAIERGIDAYMVNADRSLDSFHGTGYEIHDTEVQIHGDIALVFYVATYYYATDESTTGSVPLRSVDVFRRDDGHWNQAASHISVIPDGGRWGEGENR